MVYIQFRYLKFIELFFYLSILIVIKLAWTKTATLIQFDSFIAPVIWTSWKLTAPSQSRGKIGNASFICKVINLKSLKYTLDELFKNYVRMMQMCTTNQKTNK